MSDTLAVVTAATRIADAMRHEIKMRPTETRTTIARTIDAAIATDHPLDGTFVARTVWNMTRGTHSRAYEEVMPELGPAISRAAAFKTHPDDLVVLVREGWSSGAEDIPTYSRVIDGTEWRMTAASGRWDVTTGHDGLRHKLLTAESAQAAVQAIKERSAPADDRQVEPNAAEAFAASQQSMINAGR